MNQGIPVLLSARKDAAAKRLNELVERFVPVSADARKGRHRLIGGDR